MRNQLIDHSLLISLTIGKTTNKGNSLRVFIIEVNRFPHKLNKLKCLHKENFIMTSESHSFSLELATKYSIDEALMIKHFQHWIGINQRRNVNYHQNRTWTYQTQDYIVATFPYWNKDHVRRVLKKLLKKGILLDGNFNKRKSDRTIWYAFKDERAFAKPIPQVTKPCHVAETPHPCGGNATALPDTKTDTEDNNNNSTNEPPTKSETSKEYLSIIDLDKIEKLKLLGVLPLNEQTVRNLLKFDLDVLKQAIETSHCKIDQSNYGGILFNNAKHYACKTKANLESPQDDESSSRTALQELFANVVCPTDHEVIFEKERLILNRGGNPIVVLGYGQKDALSDSKDIITYLEETHASNTQ